MSMQEAALYGDLVSALRDYAAAQLASHAAGLTAEQAGRQVDEFIRNWFFAPQEELYGSAPREVIWREQLGEPNPLPCRYAAEIFEDDCPLCQMMCAEIESAERSEVHGHHWTYCPDFCLLDRYDPEGSEERWQKEEARLERREHPSSGADYLTRGISYGQRGNYDRALEDLHEAARLEPACAEAYYWRGLTYAFKQEYALAIQDFDRAAELQPGEALTYLNRGISHFRQQEYDHALSDLDRAIELDPDYALSYYHRGLTCFFLGNYDQAIADLGAAIRRDPDDAEAYFWRGNTYLENGDYDLAVRDFDTTIRLAPDHAAAYDQRGSAYISLGRLSLAVRDLTWAIQLAPSDWQVRFNRAAVLEEQGCRKEAISDYEQCLHLVRDPRGRQEVEERLHALRVAAG
jgi:tetratricopeptide (TPR) repeat protein